MSLSLGIIGLGRIAKVILQGLLDKGQFRPEEILCIVGQAGSISRSVKQFPNSLSVVGF